MKAISIRQPWAYCITQLGKRVENRSWGTSYRGPILIHAAKGMTKDEYDHVVFWWTHEFPGRRPLQTIRAIPAFGALSRGGIVGRANLIDCIRSRGALPFGKSRAWGDAHILPWWEGPYGFVLDDVEPLPFVPCKGRLSLFDVDESVVGALAA